MARTVVPCPPVDDQVAVEVIFGRGDGAANSSRLPPLFAHRGASRYAPEYTLDAIQAAREIKADGIELDLSFTRDNVGVLFYDDSLERTTSGEGVLAHMSFAHLRQLDAASKNPYAKNCRGCARVPTLEEGIHECLRQGLRFIVPRQEVRRARRGAAWRAVQPEARTVPPRARLFAEPVFHLRPEASEPLTSSLR
ncbi:hypothetical protein MTO96_025344 [Rhipicephalus appendiculatus]